MTNHEALVLAVMAFAVTLFVLVAERQISRSIMRAG